MIIFNRKSGCIRMSTTRLLILIKFYVYTITYDQFEANYGQGMLFLGGLKSMFFLIDYSYIGVYGQKLQQGIFVVCLLFLASSITRNAFLSPVKYSVQFSYLTLMATSLYASLMRGVHRAKFRRGPYIFFNRTFFWKFETNPYTV